jgi:hypothetical protein
MCRAVYRFVRSVAIVRDSAYVLLEECAIVFGEDILSDNRFVKIFSGFPFGGGEGGGAGGAPLRS